MNSTTITPTGLRRSVRIVPTGNLSSTLIRPKTAQEQAAEYTSMVAHEVRNPLSSINLAGEMLKSMITNDDQKKFLDIILRSSERINNTLTDIFISFKPTEMQPEKHSIHQLLDEVIEMAGDQVSLKKIAIVKDYAAEDCKIELDRPKMKVALTNIIINAIDAMSPGKGKLKLTTKTIKGKYVIQIQDNGCGISKENLKSIFKPYFSCKPGGLGLGLSTTYDTLWSNHVDVNVESEEGKGTCFILLLDKKSSTAQSELS